MWSSGISNDFAVCFGLENTELLLLMNIFQKNVKMLLGININVQKTKF